MSGEWSRISELSSGLQNASGKADGISTSSLVVFNNKTGKNSFSRVEMLWAPTIPQVIKTLDGSTITCWFLQGWLWGTPNRTCEKGGIFRFSGALNLNEPDPAREPPEEFPSTCPVVAEDTQVEGTFRSDALESGKQTVESWLRLWVVNCAYK